ncbi:septum site-determining protein MinC [Amphibacillus xylanus]|uniref:Probable septum site-determining protein MinC n=1 Tax=Amphibacillus xylanus (strain ATCC 51415 / DSM 6626 / JCM 7361 / LMG 17667 / NBRC 15112 / Ep01) TaxID=698758 RepID=K0IXI1_AMPXN|nr:septum site-determining protein MinC [Amphibacillus xylanus]BAM47150.1 septum site-determining protein MinC [Amphibacillus xylanus NBRC 15112]
MGKNQHIIIKGTRDGLTLYLDDSCSFDYLINELDQILAQDELDTEDSLIRINIQLGNRYLHKEQEEILRELIRKKKKLVVQTIESNVILKEDAIKWKEENEVRIIARTIRSGQEVSITGDLLLVGDVNPGGTVKATGNIFILGSLQGIAHAGYNGNLQAVIMASYMNPVQLRIANLYSRSPDYETEGVYMECGYVDDSNKIMIDRLQVVAKKRPELNGFERSVLNG